jgi:glycosyltransferase involved in cell wall biosynthesis
MAVRDVAPYLDEALDSVLGQVGDDDEVVVVDDGSTDATPDLLAARGDAIVHVRQEPLGISIARNLGLDHCSGRYIGFLDGDDRWAPGALGALVGALEADPTTLGVVGRSDEFVDPSVTDRRAAGLRAPETGVAALFLGAMLLRREVVDAVRFDPEQPLASTADWLVRARRYGLDLTPVEAVIVQRRLRPGSATTDGPAYQAALLASLRANLARGRGG